MSSKEKYIHKKEITLVIVSTIIVVISMGISGFLIYKAMMLKQEIPEYYILIFSSIATYTIGHTFGRMSK